MGQNDVTAFFCTVQVTGYCEFARLSSRRRGCLYFRPGFGYAGADLAKHQNLCVPQTCSMDAAAKLLSTRNLGFC